MGDTTTTVLVPLPAASGDKVSKLSKAVNKRIVELCKKANIKCEASMEVATEVGEDGEAVGLQFGFLKHQYDFECENVCTRLPRIRLDKKNTIYSASLKKVREFSAAEADAQLEEELEEISRICPSLQPELFENADKSKYWEWFLESGDEMFCLRHGDNTEIYQFGGATFEPLLINDGPSLRGERKAVRDDVAGGAALPWTKGKAFWTPQGSMLTTTHTQGVRLWGGKDFHGIIRLKHAAVQYGSFSKNEEFVATCDDAEEGKIFIHSVITGECLAKLPVPPVAPHGAPHCWPLVCWSHNSKYFALHHPEGITIHEVPGMSEVQYSVNATTKLNYLPFKNSLFSWQPNSDTTAPAVLAVWTAFKNESAPSRLTLLEIPSMQILATRNIFSVGGLARTYWQSNGTQLALVTQVQKKLLGKKRVNQTQLDIFTMKTAGKTGSVDAHWLNIEHDVVSVVWADSKNRLAVLLGNSQVLFYALSTKSGLQQCGPPMDISRDINTVAWSPLGTHFVLAACDAEDPTGTLWFGVCEDDADPSTYTPKIIHKDERAKLRHVDWDPSGRYVATSVSSPADAEHSYKLEGARGYTIWSSHGRALYNRSVEKLHRFQWRLHPLVHLTDQDREAVNKNMNKFSKAFESEDAQRKMVLRQELMEKRKAQQAEIKIAVQEAQNELMNIEGANEWIMLEEERLRARRCITQAEAVAENSAAAGAEVF